MIFVKKNWPYIFMISAFLLLVFFYLFRVYAMSDTSNACAKVEEEIKVKGHLSFKLSFKVGFKKAYGQVSSQTLRIKDFNQLKKYDCIEIKYSKSFPSIIEVTDRRLRIGLRN